MVRFGSYNLLNLFLATDPDELRRYDRIREVIRGMACDVIAVQEIRERDETVLAQFAESVGLTAYFAAPWWNEGGGSSGQVAIGYSPHHFHVGLMWNPATVTAVAGSFRSYEQGDFFHGLIKGEFLVRGADGRQHRVGHACYHAGPFGNFGGGEREAQRVVSALTRPTSARAVDLTSTAPLRAPWLVGADWNGVSADRAQDAEGRWVYYDPDPYAGERVTDADTGATVVRGTPWRDAMVYQAVWERDERHADPVRWYANRQAGEILFAGGLRDAAPALHATRPGGVPWQATAGHWPIDPFGPRRIDGIRVTREVAPALRGYEVIDTDLARSASDHLPVVVSYDPAAIDEAFPQVAGQD